ncbi:anti-sigma factor family protein [Aestuariivirga litoralis]|uniref:anti-sigma factor family protein n=1 Tax=Aestuariivirga litoralis TaxID=2650924 RepID=UPI0018C47B6F|nr:anti-sigma factor [Aestuariivirga litoralis]MBG1232099.1 anti-sigma factor [Aestuariivirga litoralis]
MMFETIENWALHAFADGELQGEEKAKIEALLATDAEARRLLEVIRQQKAALHKTFDGVLNEDVPQALLRSARHAPLARSWRGWAVAASVAAMLVGGVAGWTLRDFAGTSAVAEALPQRALDAFTVYGGEQRHPVEVNADEKDHLQKWLSKRIGVAFTVPDLSAQGYALIGGRLLPQGASPAGLLMYEDASKKRLVVYVAANAAQKDAPFKVEQHGPLVTCSWVEPSMIYAMAGPQSEAEMLPLAQAAHQGFDQKG